MNLLLPCYYIKRLLFNNKNLYNYTTREAYRLAAIEEEKNYKVCAQCASVSII